MSKSCDRMIIRLAFCSVFFTFNSTTLLLLFLYRIIRNKIADRINVSSEIKLNEPFLYTGLIPGFSILNIEIAIRERDVIMSCRGRKTKKMI